MGLPGVLTPHRSCGSGSQTALLQSTGPRLHDSWDSSLFSLRPCYFLLFSYFLSTSSAPFREPCLVDRPTASLVPILECRCSIGNNYRSQSQSMTRDLLTTQFGVCTRAEVDPSCGRRKMRRQGPKKSVEKF